MLKRKTILSIQGAAKALPSRRVSNHDLMQHLDTTDEWIVSRTGIKNRYVVTDETTASLSVDVAKQLIETHNLLPETLDFIIVATMTPDFATPSVAALVQRDIKAVNAMVLDVSAACSGFVSALSVAEKYLVSRTYKKGLVIGADCMSKLIDWQDRSTAVLFGDGAAGVLVEATDTKSSYDYIESLKGVGEMADSLIGGEQVNTSLYAMNKHTLTPYLTMNGRDIFDFVSRTVSKAIKELPSDELSSFEYVVAHQANLRLLSTLSKNTGISSDKFLTNIEHYGNTSAASIPILLADKIEDGTLKLGSNQKVLLAGFGGGLSFGLMSVQL
ncbi:beta-ketoacyl-ACP synthase 3 [Vagococcus sp. PNs007]|uniref:Beta-ketoacyl-ACP synthase 3 n=1 Tax=Vagococcus proximus TaxID=2991417 RepID=A0ABT5X1Z0_9ENTE|nr:beta-ketoacyl-ACP synthase 3 [Vagococcus proximus]MDF0480017.1 beta-ketoacyl-ACP synthase 3 [Vagococcus proximus]